MTAKVDLTLTGSLDQLRIVWQTGEALLESVPFSEDPEGTRYNILVSLQEMVTNVMRHAYDGDDAQPIGLTFEADETRFSVELRDCGPAFDPRGYDLTDVSEADEMPHQCGGYGIMIAMTVMDDVDYERRDGWNCVQLTKLVTSEALVNG